MDAKTFKTLTDRLPERFNRNQSMLGEILGRNAYTISGYGTGRVPVPPEIANLVICLDRLNTAGMLDQVEDRFERKVSLVG